MKKRILFSNGGSEGGSKSTSETSWTVRGNVTELAPPHDPIPGASVLWKGTNVGTSTDADGNYRIVVENPSTAILRYSYVGFQSLEKTVGYNATINVQLLVEAPPEN